MHRCDGLNLVTLSDVRGGRSVGAGSNVAVKGGGGLKEGRASGCGVEGKAGGRRAGHGPKTARRGSDRPKEPRGLAHLMPYSRVSAVLTCSKRSRTDSTRTASAQLPTAGGRYSPHVFNPGDVLTLPVFPLPMHVSAPTDASRTDHRHHQAHIAVAGVIG
jgi:hypothetical protein